MKPQNAPNENGRQQVAHGPPDVETEILRVNEDTRPITLQIALLVPLVAALLGLLAAFRMRRLPEPKSSTAAEMLLSDIVRAGS